MIGRSFAALWRLARLSACAAVYVLVYAAFEVDLRLLHCRDVQEAPDAKPPGP